MLPGTEIGAALAALDAMRPDVIGINCATGPGRDERAPPLPRPALPRADRVPPQRRPAVGGRGADALRPHARPAGRVPEPLRRATSACRSSAAAAAPPSSTSPRWSTRSRTSRPRRARRARGRRHVDLQLHAVRAAAHLPLDRRAHQRQRLQEVPRGDARGRLGHVRGDGPRAGEGGRPRPRRLRRLRRPRRHRRHGRDRVALRHPGHRPADDRLHRAAGHRDGAPVDRRPGHPQLGQPRGRRRAGHPARPLPVAGPRVRRRRRLHLHRRGGPGPHARVEAARRPRPIHDIAVDRYGLEPGDLFFDPLALTLGTGMEESRGDGVATLEGIRLIKEHLPGVHTTLGLSNISFGLNPAARHVLNSVFLHEAAQAGLDSAIVHAARIMPLARIPEEQKQVCLDVIYDRRTDDYDPLQELLSMFEGVTRRRRSRRRTAPTGRSSSASPPASSTATATASPPTSTTPSTPGHTPLGHHQRRPPRGHEGRRRPLRQGRDAAAVRAAVGRDDEGRRRLPRADDGQGRRRVHQGPHRARHGEGRRPRHRQEPRRHHPHQQRLRGAQPRHQGERRPRWSTRPSR